MSDVRIADGKVVSIAYKLQNSQGQLLEEATPDDPMLYLHGHDNMVPGLEKELAGKAVGDRVITVVSPEEGYGAKQSKGEIPVPRDAFPSDADIFEGATFITEDQGRPMPIWVVRADAETVWIDTDHPLAGQNLHFAVEVLSIRTASPVELEHGHPHGADGHAHH